MPPEQGEGPTSAEVVTVPPPLDAWLQQRADTVLGDDPEGEAQGDPDEDGGTPAALKGPTRPRPDRTPPTPRDTEGPFAPYSNPVWSEQSTPGPPRCPEGEEEPQTPGACQPPPA